MRTTAKHDPGRKRPHGLVRATQAGFALVELVVSAAVIVAIAGGALTALQASNRTTAEERHRARAHGIAQEDQARLRSLRISDLSNLEEERIVTRDGTAYTVSSSAEFVTDATGTTSCEQGTASADYIKISSVGELAVDRDPAAGAPPEHRRAAERLDRRRSWRAGGRRPQRPGPGRPRRRAVGQRAGHLQRLDGRERLRDLRQPAARATTRSRPSAPGLVDRDGEAPVAPDRSASSA